LFDLCIAGGAKKEVFQTNIHFEYYLQVLAGQRGRRLIYLR
jgi:hypothetical protein